MIRFMMFFFILLPLVAAMQSPHCNNVGSESYTDDIQGNLHVCEFCMVHIGNPPEDAAAEPAAPAAQFTAAVQNQQRLLAQAGDSAF